MIGLFVAVEKLPFEAADTVCREDTGHYRKSSALVDKDRTKLVDDDAITYSLHVQVISSHSLGQEWTSQGHPPIHS